MRRPGRRPSWLHGAERASLKPRGAAGAERRPNCLRAGAGRTMRPRSRLDLGSVWAQRLRQLEQRLRVSPAARRRKGRRGAGWGAAGRELVRPGRRGQSGARDDGQCPGPSRLSAAAFVPLHVKGAFVGSHLEREFQTQPPAGRCKGEIASPGVALEMGVQRRRQPCQPRSRRDGSAAPVRTEWFCCGTGEGVCLNK